MAVVTVQPLAAQAEALRQVAQTITAADVARHVGVMADDSMLGRDTPSHGLELTARYVAEQFRKIGLEPVNPDSGWISHYTLSQTVPLQLDASRSRLVFKAGNQQAIAGFSNGAYLIKPWVPQEPVTASVALVTGLYDREIGADVKSKLRGKIALYILPTTGDSARRQQSVEGFINYEGSRGTIILSNHDGTAFSTRPDAKGQQLFISSWTSWSAAVHVDAAVGLREMLAAAGVDLIRARADTAPRVIQLPSLQVTPDLQIRKLSNAAPNVVGLLEGRDSVLKHQYLIFTAHMDHIGVTPGVTDSINNGADDNASGVAGLIALANAFAQPGLRPRRTLVFAAVSGGAIHRKTDEAAKNGAARFLGAKQWARVGNGSRVDSRGMWAIGSPFDTSRIVRFETGNINLDMIGGHAGDSVMVAGLKEVELMVPLEWIVARDPELRLTVVDGGTAFAPSSEHFVFAQAGRPVLSFSTGSHEKPRSTDSPGTLNADQAARVLRLVFYVGHELANASTALRWNAEGRRILLKRKGQ